MLFQPRQKAVTLSGTLAPIHKFTKPGETIEGIYNGKRQGKATYPPLIIVGAVALPQKKQLEDYFAEIPVGSYVWVTFLEKVNIPGGKTLNKFDVDFALSGSGGAAPFVASPVVPAAETPAPAVTASAVATLSEYDRLIGLLTVVNPKGAAAIKGALEQLYPDESTRLTKLQETLKQQGIAS